MWPFSEYLGNDLDSYFKSENNFSLQDLYMAIAVISFCVYRSYKPTEQPIRSGLKGSVYFVKIITKIYNTLKIIYHHSQSDQIKINNDLQRKQHEDPAFFTVETSIISNKNEVPDITRGEFCNGKGVKELKSNSTLVADAEKRFHPNMIYANSSDTAQLDCDLAYHRRAVINLQNKSGPSVMENCITKMRSTTQGD